ncbi:hypothetical protein E2542_SST05555 [Spatholobus suberectus]|nr:hypothetical protein E2542_SST05555 [Spatholobus suberectus]
MGNSLGGKKTTKVMKIDGETFKLKTPVKVCDVLKDHPGLVLLESEAVKHYGIRAKPLEAHKELQPKRLYFLVELPGETVPRRVRSGINMSAKDRLESLVLARRSASDLTIMKPPQSHGTQNARFTQGSRSPLSQPYHNGGMRFKMRLPKAEVERLIQGCETEAEAAEKIMGLCMANGGVGSGNGETMKAGMQWKGARGRDVESTKAREKRVSFMPIIEGGSPIAVAS